MKRFILTLILTLILTSCAWADHPITSAKFNFGGNSIHVILDNGEEMDVPDDLDNRHRRQLEEWIDEGNIIASANPKPVKTRKELIQSDPLYPTPADFLDAMIECRLASKCAAITNMKVIIDGLKIKYP